MAIRLRRTEHGLVAICAARSVPKEGDIYLDDEVHRALSNKFALDFNSMRDSWVDKHKPVSEFTFPVDKDVMEVVEREESNNENRTWWDTQYPEFKYIG